MREYRKRYGKEADDQSLHEFFFLFSGGKDGTSEKYRNMLGAGSNSDLAYKKFAEHEPEYHGIEDFLRNVR